MSTSTLDTPPAADLIRTLVRHHVDDYHRMLDAGALPEDATLELLDGLVVRKIRSLAGENPMSHGHLHRLAISMLMELHERLHGSGCFLDIQLPIRVSEFSEPEPDACIIRGRREDYSRRFPTGAEAICVIEVAHESLARDRGVKLALYARAGIGQYVIVNLRESVVEVYQAPDRERGVYAEMATYQHGQSLALQLPGGRTLPVGVDEMLP
jgi:Uma2 family endonuclease